MKTKTSKWDAADYMHSDADQTLYLQACFDDDPGDGSLVRAALGDVARAKNMTQLARDTGISREGLYKALSQEGNPEFSTIMRVMHALGIRLQPLPYATA